MTFDYGNKLPDGQHQFHPTRTEGECVAPFRKMYLHRSCKSITSIGDDIAETYAKNPTFYSRTFCCGCGGYFPIAEFEWTVDGVELGQIPTRRKNLIQYEGSILEVEGLDFVFGDIQCSDGDYITDKLLIHAGKKAKVTVEIID